MNWWPSTWRMAAKGSTGRSLQGSVAEAIELAKPGRPKACSIGNVPSGDPSAPSFAKTSPPAGAGRYVPYEIQYIRDGTARTVAWIALICGAISLSITIGRFICEIW